MSAREPLPQRRAACTINLAIGPATFAVTAGFYPDGRVGEVFVTAPKVGSDIEAILRDGAILLSFALQHGAPLDELVHAMTRNPSGEVASVLGRLTEAVRDHLAEEFLRLARAT
jgi:ribonucleoside-diphosphate reductase alpha chain